MLSPLGDPEAALAHRMNEFLEHGLTSHMSLLLLRGPMRDGQLLSFLSLLGVNKLRLCLQDCSPIQTWSVIFRQAFSVRIRTAPGARARSATGKHDAQPQDRSNEHDMVVMALHRISDQRSSMVASEAGGERVDCSLVRLYDSRFGLVGSEAIMA